MRRRQKTRDGIYFVLDVPAGVKDRIIVGDRETFVAPGSVTIVRAKFYGGQENTLLLKPVLIDAQGTYDEIIDTRGDRGKGFICGEDEDFVAEVDVPFDRGDRLGIEYENNNTAGETYTLKIWIGYQYEGGELNGRTSAVR